MVCVYISANAADDLFGFTNPLTQRDHSEDEDIKIGDSQYDMNKETTVSLADRESITEHTKL